MAYKDLMLAMASALTETALNTSELGEGHPSFTSRPLDLLRPPIWVKRKKNPL